MSKIKEHFKNHKEKYLIGVGALAVGVGAGLYFRQVQISVSNPALMNWKPTSNTIQVQINRRGNPGHVIQSSDGRVWPSIRATCEDLNINRKDMTEHLNGLLPNINGLSFKKVGEV